jgi:hypothetical protein
MHFVGKKRISSDAMAEKCEVYYNNIGLSGSEGGE